MGVALLYNQRMKQLLLAYYLFRPWFWCNKEVCFTQNARVHASSYGILFPSQIEIVDYMCISMADPAKIQYDGKRM